MNRRSILAAYKKKSSHFQTGVTGFKSGNLFKKGHTQSKMPYLRLGMPSLFLYQLHCLFIAADEPYFNFIARPHRDFFNDSRGQRIVIFLDLQIFG